MFKILLALLFITPINAGLPPTTTKGSGDSTDITTFKIRAPNIPITHSGTTATIGTIPVVGGGTGLTTLTANNVILGNGTSTPSFVAPGTSGNVLTSNGTTWSSQAAAAGSGNISAVGATGSIGFIRLAFGTSNTNSDCTGSPCLLNQIGTDVTSMTRSGTGAYTLNFARTYTTLICTFSGFNGGSNVQAFLGNNQIICASCNSIAFTLEKVGLATDAHGVIDCVTNY